MKKKHVQPAAILSLLIVLAIIPESCKNGHIAIEASQEHDIVFNNLPKLWDEAIPLGNGMLGALVWKKGKNMRISLDRADLWDLRPMENMYDPEFTYNWVYEQWKNKTYLEAQMKGDRPYDESAGPSKIPAAAIELPIEDWGPIQYVRLFTHHGICKVVWENGIEMEIFVDATEPAGWMRITGKPPSASFYLIPPLYYLENTDILDDPVTGQDLRLLGYPRGNLVKNKNSMSYTQEGWNGFEFQVHLNWSKHANDIWASWSISSHQPGSEKVATAEEMVKNALNKGYEKSLENHLEWWSTFWSQSGISLPDSILEKQWYLEQYKFGSAARNGAPPISLQAIWTADNGRLPPWKGDFHHDLNTQLSYWPAYSGNHLDLEEGFLEWLWSIREEGFKYTQWYYQAEGLNIPGVTTLTGQPMGGWIQYSLGPTVSAWLGHHFYLHWLYSGDKNFLKDRAYPWISDVALFLEQISEFDENGNRKLPISSSPEIFNNSREAWFSETTNFDLSLIRFTYQKAMELAEELDLKEDVQKWENILNEWPDLDIDAETGFTFAPGFPYEESHRHFSHLMAFHPLGLVDWSQGPFEQEIIINTLNNLEEVGTDYWVGYSFSWLGNLYARAMMGEKAAEVLRIFATSFTVRNSFHVNGDQSGKGYSNFVYRPFTLEGNFAFAAGIQDMLMQSHSGVIKVFPALPDAWKDVSFENFRAVGAFLVSATMEGGQVQDITIHSEKEGEMRLQNPFVDMEFQVEGIHPERIHIEGEHLVVHTVPGEHFTFHIAAYDID